MLPEILFGEGKQKNIQTDVFETECLCDLVPVCSL